MPEGPTRGGGAREPDNSPDSEPAPHGAAAPLPVSGRQPRSRRLVTRGSDGAERPSLFSRLRRLPISGYQLVLIVLLALVLIALSPIGLIGGRGVAAAFTKTPRNKIGISYGGGPTEAAHFQRIVQPGSALFYNGLFDDLYLYPADQQNYIVTLNPRAGAQRGQDSLVAPTADRVAVTYQVAIYFKLNTDLLREFHEQLGLQYSAYTTRGWNNLLQDTFRQNIENAVQEQTRRYTVAELYGNSQNLVEFQRSVQDDFGDRLISALGQPYFCSPSFEPGQPCGGPTFIVKQIDIPQPVAAAFVNEQAAQIQVGQRRAEAEGVAELNRSGVNINGQNYVMLKAIENGQVTFWVVPEGSGLNLPSGGGATGAPTTPSGGSTPTSTVPPNGSP